MKATAKVTLTFGIVNIPVGVYTAVSEQKTRFRMLHEKCHSPLSQKYVCENCDATIPVPTEDRVKGYEEAENQFVVISSADLDALKPASSKAMRVTQFCPFSTIPLEYILRTHYLAPSDAVGREAYDLIVQVLQQKQLVGIVETCLRETEHIAALVASDDVLRLVLLYWPADVRPPDSLEHEPQSVSSEMLKIAGTLIDSMTVEKFDPLPYKNTYEEKVVSLIKERQVNPSYVPQVVTEKEAKPTSDLMAALKASVDMVSPKSEKPSKSAKPSKPKKKATKR